MSQIIQPASLVTLRYRISTESGQILIDTFAGTPATLQLGHGELMPALESLLQGMAVGQQESFTLSPEQGFGPYRDELVERVARHHMPPEEIEPMSFMEFTAPDGSRYAGLVREIDAESALVDFNHPLAGKAVRFDVEIVGIL